MSASLQNMFGTVLSSPYLFGLLAGAGTYLAIDHLKPAPIYTDGTTLHWEFVNPTTVGAAAAIAGIYYVNNKNSSSSYLMGGSL